MANITLPQVIPAFNGVLCMAPIGECVMGELPAPEYVRIGGVENTEVETPMSMINAPTYDTGGWMTKVPSFKEWSATVDTLFLDNNDAGQTLVVNTFFAGNITESPTASCGVPEGIGCEAVVCNSTNPVWFKFLPDGCVSALNPSLHLQYVGIGYISNYGIVGQVEDKLMLNLEITGTGALVPGLVDVDPEG